MENPGATALTLLAVGLASYRAARLVTTDTLTASLRRRILTAFPGHVGPLYDDAGRKVQGDVGTNVPSWPVRFVNCSWCVGWWAAGAGLVAAHLLGLLAWRWLPIGWPAAATVAGCVDVWVER